MRNINSQGENMNNFANALRTQSNFTTTENGRLAHKSTTSHLLDFFYRAASMRTAPASKGSIKKNGKRYNAVLNPAVTFEASENAKEVKQLFFNAFEENPALAVATLFWLRDVRQGAGERQIFRTIYNAAINDVRTKAAVLCVANKIAEYGRWDDVWNCVDPFDQKLSAVLEYILSAGLNDSNTAKLLAKWLPRERGKNVALANRLAEILKMTPKTYRNVCSALSEKGNVVEQKMSAKKWDEIVFDNVPSMAMSRYTNAFTENATEAFEAYKEKLVKGTAKVNASAIYPYEIVKNMTYGSHDEVLCSQQWKALPNFIPDGTSVLPIVDVSGSMSGVSVAKGVSALDVALSLGMYCAERNNGPFKDLFMTFSSKPEFVDLNILGRTLSSRIRGMNNANWEMNTDLDRAFKAILTLAVRNNTPQSELPTTLLVITDGQIDCMCSNQNSTFMNDVRKNFEMNGYKLPNVIWWNMNGQYKNVPVTKDYEGVGLISGFSPAIMKSLLAGESVTPMDQMLEVIASDRYVPIIDAVMEMLNK
jgi:hypothetical protein